MSLRPAAGLPLVFCLLYFGLDHIEKAVSLAEQFEFNGKETQFIFVDSQVFDPHPVFLGGDQAIRGLCAENHFLDFCARIGMMVRKGFEKNDLGTEFLQSIPEMIRLCNSTKSHHPLSEQKSGAKRLP